MLVIDWRKIKDALPKRAIVSIRHRQLSDGSIVRFIHCEVKNPMLCESDIDMIVHWLTGIIKPPNIESIYLHPDGLLWQVNLKPMAIYFDNYLSSVLVNY